MYLGAVSVFRPLGGGIAPYLGLLVNRTQGRDVEVEVDRGRGSGAEA